MNRRSFLAGLGLAGSTALTGCATSGSTSGGTRTPSTNESDTLRLAYDAAPPHFQAVVMDQEGWFDEMSFPVESESAGCKSIVQLLVSGKVDVGMIVTIPALVVADSETPASIVSASSKNAFVVMIESGLTDLFENETGGFADFAEDRGRPFKLGTYPKGSVSDITARYWITEVRDSSLEDVDLVHLDGPGASRQALLAGEVEGAVIPEPTPTLIEERTSAPYERIAQVGDFIPGEPAGVTMVRDEFATSHPDYVEAFVSYHARATDFINDRPDRAASYMSDVYGGESSLDAKTARAALDSPATEYVSDPHDITSGTEVLTEYAAHLGKTETVLEVEQIFDTQYYDRTVE